MSTGRFHCGDCLKLLRALPDNSVDLVMCSPPYEAARTYGIGFNLRGQEWVDWCLERYLECVRVCRGVVAWNVEGQTHKFRWSAVPALLMADLHRAGVNLRKPPIFARIGIPGSGGKDWFRNDYEFVICSTKGKLPWSDNTAMGHVPKWKPGGKMSNRHKDGRRKNESAGPRAHQRWDGKIAEGGRVHTKTGASGVMETQCYLPPKLANPGNIIRCKVGGGLMGSQLAHENEAPFPERLAEWFIRSCCPPGGTVLDPFSGSGTTVCVAVRCGRNGIGFDIRDSQVELGYRRLNDVQKELFI